MLCVHVEVVPWREQRGVAEQDRRFKEILIYSTNLLFAQARRVMRELDEER